MLLATLVVATDALRKVHKVMKKKIIDLGVTAYASRIEHLHIELTVHTMLTCSAVSGRPFG